MVHVLFVAGVAFCAPHEPQLENVIVAATLDDLVAGVVADVVLFVLLKQIVGAHLVATHEQILYIWLGGKKHVSKQQHCPWLNCQLLN